MRSGTGNRKTVAGKRALSVCAAYRKSNDGIGQSGQHGTEEFGIALRLPATGYRFPGAPS